MAALSLVMLFSVFALITGSHARYGDAPSTGAGAVPAAGSSNDTRGYKIEDIFAVGVNADAGSAYSTAFKFSALPFMKLSLALATIEKDGVVTPHTHLAEEIVCFIEGTIRGGALIRQGADFTVVETIFGPGSCVAIPPGRLHWATNVGGSKVKVAAAFDRQDIGTNLWNREIQLLPADIFEYAFKTKKSAIPSREKQELQFFQFKDNSKY